MKSPETTTVRLLDAWKAKKAITSDNQAALALKISRASVSGWRLGKSHAKPSHAAVMAKELGLDELSVLAAIEADRAHEGDDRRVWQKHGRAAFMALVLGLTVGLPQGGSAQQLRQLGQGLPLIPHQSLPLCEIPRWKRRKRPYRGPWMARAAQFPQL